MASLAADLHTESYGDITTLPFSCNAADTFYAGAVVFADASGGVQVTAVAGDMPIGISPSQQTTTAAGQLVSVVVSGIVVLPAGSLTAADEGNLIGFDAGTTITDNPNDAVNLSGITLADNDCILGKVMRVYDSKMMVQLGQMTGTKFIAAQDVFV